MVTKIFITVGIIAGALMALRVLGGAAEARMARNEEQARDSVRRKLKGEDFVKCEECGAYTAPAEVCSCNR